MDVNKLPRELQSQLRSDMAVRNVSNCVIELVENALDANASSIAVRINFDTFRLEVVDNGVGLGKEDLALVGERYCTSKKKDAPEIQISRHFGYRGEGLANIKSASSRVMIVSRALHEKITYCKVFDKSGSAVHQSHVERKTMGTTVIVENFLQKLPVRQRCTKPSEEFQTIKWFLQATALMFPKVNFSLRDDNRKSEVFRIDRTNSTASTFLALFPGAIESSDSFLKLKTTHENINVKLMLSKETCNTDQLQFVFVNKRYLPQCDVQKYFNKLLDRIDPAKKKISQKTVYILNLSCPREDYDIELESDRRLIQFKSWSKVKQSLINLVKLLVGDEHSHRIEDSPVKKPSKQIVPAKNPFDEINTANTVFGLPANRPKVKKSPEVYDIDDKSNSDDDAEKKKKAEASNSRASRRSGLFGVSKASHMVKKNTKPPKSPRLIDQGVLLTYTKSPKASRKFADEKPVRKNDKNRNLKSRDDYGWMWKQSDKDIDSDSTEFSGAHEIGDRSRLVASKNEKRGKDLTAKKNRGERFKSMVALSTRRTLRLPTRERISKKQNHYFDKNENNQNNVIEKYGKVSKTLPNVLKDDLIAKESRDLIGAGDGGQWTAKISVNQSTSIIPPVTLFDKPSSLDLDLEDDLRHQSNQPDTSMAKLPPHDDHPIDRVPLQENRRRYDWKNLFDDSVNPEIPLRAALKEDHVVGIKAVDAHSRVSEWISKLPPPEETILNDSACDYITPLNDPRTTTEQMANDFKSKTKLSKSPGDSLSLDRTPEKRKSTQEAFEPKCKQKLNFDSAQAEAYELEMETCPKSRNKSLSLDWNSPDDQKSNRDIDLFTHDKLCRKPDFYQPTQIMTESLRNQMNANEYPKFEENDQPTQIMDSNWHDLNDSKDFSSKVDGDEEDLFYIKKSQPLSTHTSDCPNQCLCKCHKKCPSKGPKSTDVLKMSIPTQIPQLDGSQEEDKKTVISIKSDDVVNVDGKDTTMASQQFVGNSRDTQDSDYFPSKNDLLEKLKFKMKFKFLESSSAVDIPKGMLEMSSKNESKIEKLNEDERKALDELVRPYKMQNHITLDDFGNSCLRIFPMLKNQPKKSEGVDVEDLNCSVIFTKEDIPSFEFIAQIENKFILASAIVQSTQSPMLILLDQHAVDERIRVERLLRDYTKNGHWLSTPINPHINLSVPSNYSSLFTDNQSHFEEFGLHFELNNKSKNKETKLVVSFTEVPTCFYNRAMRESNNFHTVLKQLIESLTKEMLKKFISQGTLVHAVPNELQNVVNYEACRGAVKFGDKLTSQVCSALLEAMGQCQLPFQCAHGRPSVIPLVNFDKLVPLQKQILKPDWKKLISILD